MKIQKAQRKRAKIKMGIQGPSGSGKTYSSLLIAYGLCGDFEKVVVVDTENHSSELYANMGDYSVLALKPPFTPESYIEAINQCEKAGFETIIIDSVSHEWENLLEFHAGLQGNSFANWGKVTPRHNDFVHKILQSPCHIIATLRTKQDYIISEKNGKMTPEKVGLKSVQRDGLDYEFTLVFDLDMSNHATASKDRTGLFFGNPAGKLTINTGITIKDWCNEGSEPSESDVMDMIKDCHSIQDLLALYKLYPKYNQSLRPEFEKRKAFILQLNENATPIVNQNINQNGTV